MSRFDFDDDEGIPYGLWEQMVSNALSGERGQAALAELEVALTALPHKRLVYGNLAADDTVCAVGAYVASERSKRLGIPFQEAVAMLNRATQCSCRHTYADHAGTGKCTAMSRTMAWDTREAKEGTCTCEEFKPEKEYISETVEAGRGAGLKYTVAWHLAYLNDEQFEEMSPEERYEATLAWVQRAQGKEVVNA